MATQNFHALPKLRDSSSYLYLAYGALEQTKLGIEFINKTGNLLLPVANLCTIMLGPGTTVTHAAMKTVTAHGCNVVWGGEEGVRTYALGIGETHKAYKLMHQAECCSYPEKRLKVIRKMYQLRFKEKLEPHLDLQKIRGKEGSRVKTAYAQAALQYGIEWKGRNYDRSEWENSDLPNRALSAANACLHGVAHAAIISAGYSAGLGFIHQGKQLAFAYDIADLYKIALSVPAAFSAIKEINEGKEMANLESEVRKRMRQGFKNLKLMDRILSDIETVLDIKTEELPDGFDPDDDPTNPTRWWSPDYIKKDENFEAWKSAGNPDDDLPF